MNADELKHVAERQGRITAEIFRIREQIDLYLQANDIHTVNRLLAAVSVLEEAKRSWAQV